MNVARTVLIYVQVSSTALGTTAVSSDYITFSYDRPSLTSVSYVANASNANGMQLQLAGNNLCKSEACCRTVRVLNDTDDTNVDYVVSHTHNSIVLGFYEKLNGQLRVVCTDGVKSDPIAFKSNSAYIFGTVPQLNGYQFDTLGNETFEIWGIYFGEPDTVNLTVTIGGNVYLKVLSHTSVSCVSPDRPATAASFGLDSEPTNCSKVVVSTPAYTGRNLPLVVNLANATQTEARDSRFEFLSYYLPVITSASGEALTKSLTSEGGDKLILSGRYFGVQQGSIQIGYVSNDLVSCNIANWTDTQVICTVGPGEGINLPVSVVQQTGGSTQAASPISVNFLPPSNLKFNETKTFSTTGGEVFEIFGDNFGRPNKSVVTVTRTTGATVTSVCKSIFSNYSYVSCIFPEGEGYGINVTLTVGGQTTAAKKTVNYSIPEIYSITPSNNLPTAGGITIRIKGKNFGVKYLDLYFGPYRVARRNDTYDPFVYVINGTNGTDHTNLVLSLPPFYGVNKSVTVTVGGQDSPTSATISFAKPVIGSISVVNDGTNFSASRNESIPAVAFGPDGADLPSISRRRRRLGQDDAYYGLWNATSFGPCESSFKATSFFWKSHTMISSNGHVKRRFKHYNDSTCTSEIFLVTVNGRLVDTGAFNGTTVACGLSRVFTDTTAEITIDTLTATAINSSRVFAFYDSQFTRYVTRYGVYIVSDDKDIYLSTTYLSMDELNSRVALKFPDQPSASSTATWFTDVPKGPTDGCNTWESLTDFSNRVALLEGNAKQAAQRLCTSKALLEVTGLNLGSLNSYSIRSGMNDTNEPKSLRVFLESATDSFEARTVLDTSENIQTCQAPECYQTDTRIRFWIPFGYGKSLQIRVSVGGQSETAATRFSYSSPSIIELNPGTVKLGRQFMNGPGGESVMIRGLNFGGRRTIAGVLISGRPCLNSVWNLGTNTDVDGRNYITCDTQEDVVGPKSVMICVANQLSFTKLYRTDGPILLAGEALDAWNTSKTFAVEYSSKLKSTSLTRCPSGTTGRLYELCAECPTGAECEDGSFSGPKSSANFFDYSVTTFNDDGTPTDRAVKLCASEAWNSTFADLYPDLVQRTTCNSFVGCEPKTACIGNSMCATGYEYAYPRCLIKRYGNATAFAQLTRATVANTSNSCGVTLNPYTYEYEGNDQECRGSLADGDSCASDNPEQCSKCTVFKDGDSSYFGACECTMPARCSLCTIQTHYRLNNECVACPENPGLLIGGLFAIAIAVAVLGWYLQRENVNLAFITIGIDYFQVLAIFSATKVPWPAALQQLFNIMSVFNFNIDITAPECITPNFGYEVKWGLQMGLPVALLVVLLMTYFGYAGVKMVRWGIYQSHVYTSHLSALIAIFMIAMYYLYLVLTKKALEIFNCNPVDPDDGFLYTAFTSLSCDGGGLCRCNEPGGVQQSLVPWAIASLVFYTFGYPAYVALVLKRNSLLVKEDQYLRAYEVGYVRKTNPDCYDMRKRYSKLYYQFKPRYASFWILVLLIRKFWIAFAFILFRGNPSFQLAVVLLVLFTSLVFQVLWRPFLSTGDRQGIVRELDAMAERSIKEPAFAEYREIQKRVQECMTLDVEHRRRQKQTKQGAQLFSGTTEDAGKNLGLSLMAKPREKVSRSVAAARWFTNLNTLEFILLGCGILVCLAGIMFEASSQDKRALVRAQVDAITYIVVIVVIVSFIYYLVFFLAEVTPAAISTIISLCKKKIKKDEEDYYDPNINLEENPMFAAPKVEFADNRTLQAELDQQLAQLKLAEQQNKRLREELKNKKMEAQLDETSREKATGLEDVKPNKQRKDFAQTRLTAQLIGPNRQRARGNKKVTEEDDEEEDPEALSPRQSRRSVFTRMSVAFKKAPKADEE